MKTNFPVLRNLQNLQTPTSLETFYDVERKMQETFDSLFQAFRSPTVWEHEGNYPRINIVEKKKDIHVAAAIPGLKKEDVDVSYKEGLLVIRGNTQNEAADEDEKYICREIKKSSFVRTIQLNDSLVDIDSIKCTCEDGMLNITIPKRKELLQKEEVKKITIE